MADIAQIQIVPVDNGFFIQVINADGSGTSNPRRVANNRDELAKEVKKLADGLYTKEPPAPAIPGQPTPSPTAPVAVAPPDKSAPAGTAPKV